MDKSWTSYEITLLKKDAESGDAIAQCALARCYSEGDSVNKNLKTAVYWAQKAADQGEAAAQFFLGKCYEQGNGVKADHELSSYWYHKAADQGHGEAQFFIGSWYYVGVYEEKNLETAAKWFQKAYENNIPHPNKIAFFVIGFYHLGNYKGNGSEESAKSAVYWLEKAAVLGHAEAQYNIAMCYYAGVGVKQDLKESAQWFLKAAEQGDTLSQYELSMCYLKGEGIQKSIGNAARWFIKVLEEEPEKEQEWMDTFHASDATELSKSDIDNFLDSVAKQQKQQRIEGADKERKQRAQQGLCPNCGEKPGLFGKCKKCGADKLLGLRTSDEWKKIIDTATRPLEVRIKHMATPSLKLAAIRDTQIKIASKTGHPVELVKKIYEKYANKSVQKDSAFK